MIKPRLKERENIRRYEDQKLVEDGKAELKRIAKEIEDEKDKNNAKVKLYIRKYYDFFVLVMNDFVLID